jgi:hypothetical protein
MQLSPQALPLEQTLQQAAKADEAQAGEAQVIPAGPIASDAAATRIVENFMANPPRLEEDASRELGSRILPRHRFTTYPTGARSGPWRDTRAAAEQDAIDSRMAERDEETGEVHLDPLVLIEPEVEH